MTLYRSLPFLLAGSVAVASSRAPIQVNVTGDYASNWNDVRLVQEGNRVHGTYVCCGGGTIEGRIIEGRVLRYHWHEPNGAGHGEGVWRITPAGRLEGTWGFGQDDHDGGPWTLDPKRPKSQNVIAQ